MSRFEFGKNWAAYLAHINEEMIGAATARLLEKVGRLDGLTFLDIGCGSGIHSLAAVRLGASRVHSFDYDRNSVECAFRLKERFAGSAEWSAEQGSALDEAYLRSLGRFDLVYSWGVLHHTGDMWTALKNATIPMAEDGRLFVAIYNDQGGWSRLWTKLKHRYVNAGRITRTGIEMFVWMEAWGQYLLRAPVKTVREWKNYSEQRGMSPWYDIVDWAGGYPFEVATPEAIFRFYRDLGLRLEELFTCGGGKGCNEFLFSRSLSARRP